MGGLMSITGAPGEGPMRVGIPVADLTAGLFCAMGILTALLERDVSGEGQWVQTSLLQAQIFMLDFQASRWLMEGQVPKQAGNNHPTSIPTGVFKTSDGYINIATASGKIWERLAHAIGASELIENPDYKTAPSRSKNRDALNAAINERTAKRTSAEWVEELNKAGVPCGPIYSVDQMFDDAQVKHLGIAQDVPNAENRKIRLVGQPVTLSRTPSRMAARPPEVGEQTDEILGEFGFSADEISALRKEKVV
jgi:formyl-CoA transferase